jgi:hypothetical protein
MLWGAFENTESFKGQRRGRERKETMGGRFSGGANNLNKEEALQIILTALDAQMKFTAQNMIEHPGLGYGIYYDKLEQARKYLEENWKC